MVHEKWQEKWQEDGEDLVQEVLGQEYRIKCERQQVTPRGMHSEPYERIWYHVLVDGEKPDGSWGKEAKLTGAKIQAAHFIKKAKLEAEIAAGIAIDTIDDLYDKLVKVANEPQDSRWQQWVKHITGIDTSKSNGYMYEGEFVETGTVETADKNGVYLVMTRSGSRKYQTSYYRVVRLIDGKLYRTDIATTDEKKGWALRLRESIRELLEA